MEAQVLIVTSAGAPSAAVVPVIAAIEAAGMRVRAIDVGAAGGGGAGVADRVRRAILGDAAERRLRRELEISPPDAAVVFDPHAALALTVARDQVQNPAPVIAVVGELEPAGAWAETDADRFAAVDDLAAVALADAGVEGDRILLVGGKLVALVDDNIAGSARAAAALEARRRATAAKGLLLLSSALDSAFGGSLPAPFPDGGDNVADIVAAVAADKRGVIDERRLVAQAATRDRVRAASAAANAVAQAAAMPGELEDLGGGSPAEPAQAP